MARGVKETRANFEAGKVDAWTAGEHGATVRVFVEAGKVKVRFRNRSKQLRKRTLYAAATSETRRLAAAAAQATADALRAGLVAEQPPANGEDTTIGRIAELYMARVPGFPKEAMGWTRTRNEAWYETLPEDVRAAKTTPSCGTVWTDAYGFRRIFADPRFAPDRRVGDLEPGDASTYAADYIAGGKSPRTATNDLDRLSCAIRYVVVQHRKTVGLRYNPLEGRIVDRTKADIARYTDEEGRKMREVAPELVERRMWQVLVAAGIATSGRRIGSIVSLTLADHDFDAGTVVWRAEHAKGEHYGRGDEVRPMTATHRQAVLWAAKHRPNPNGPDAPLLWQSRDARRRVPPATIWKQLMELEKKAGVPHIDGRAWHAFRRWAATFLADAVGDGQAAEFIGMTTDTLRRYRYKKVQAETMERVANAIDERTS